MHRGAFHLLPACVSENNQGNQDCRRPKVGSQHIPTGMPPSSSKPLRSGTDGDTARDVGEEPSWSAQVSEHDIDEKSFDAMDRLISRCTA
mmetsp:Transcript_65595/g.200926  ORF Transcript_65595/g.200926 Transcript_65595/m.200926 type:complete len:90 (-) Transcript_65595:587-856(-)